MTEGRERRRMARIPIQCVVVVREKLATSETRTEDVGPRGCQIVLKRHVAPGTLLQLRFLPGEGSAPLEAVGQVAWSRRTPPLVAGIVFVSAPRAALNDSGGNWLEILLAAQLQRVVRGELELGALGKVQLELGIAPRFADPHELSAVRVARAGGTISAVARSLEELAPLVGLLQRGTVTVARAKVEPRRPARRLAEFQDAPTPTPAVGPAAVIVPPLPETLRGAAGIATTVK